MRGRGSERGWGSVWSSQPGLLSHLQPLSLFYTQIHTRAHIQYTFSLSLSLTFSHTHTRTGWQPHDTATTHHSMPLLYPLNHSLANHMQINIPLSSGHIHHVNNKIHHFARLPRRSCDKTRKSMTVFMVHTWNAVPTYVQPWKALSWHRTTFDQMLLQMTKIGAYFFNLKLLIRAYISYLSHNILVFNHDVLVLCPVGWKFCASF